MQGTDLVVKDAITRGAIDADKRWERNNRIWKYIVVDEHVAAAGEQQGHIVRTEPYAPCDQAWEEHPMAGVRGRIVLALECHFRLDTLYTHVNRLMRVPATTRWVLFESDRASISVWGVMARLRAQILADQGRKPGDHYVFAGWVDKYWEYDELTVPCEDAPS